MNYEILRNISRFRIFSYRNKLSVAFIFSKACFTFLNNTKSNVVSFNIVNVIDDVCVTKALTGAGAEVEHLNLVEPYLDINFLIDQEVKNTCKGIQLS